MAEYIEKEAAIRQIRAVEGEQLLSRKAIRSMIERVNSIPAADVRENVKGEWVDKRITVKGGHGLTYGRWGCSKCKAKQEHRTPFCPNCGAEMTGGNDG